MLSAIALLSTAAIALPSSAAPEQALTFENVQGYAKLKCTPFYNVSGADVIQAYKWSEYEVYLKSEDSKFEVSHYSEIQTSSYKIDGVPDNFKFTRLEAYRGFVNGLDTLKGFMIQNAFVFVKDRLVIDITSTPNSLSSDLGPCSEELAGGFVLKEILLGFQTVKLRIAPIRTRTSTW
jgi:hypothetical protein